MELCRPAGITVLRLPRIESMLNSSVCTLGLDLLKTDTSSDSSHRKRAHSDLSIVMCRELRGGGAKHLPPQSAREEASEVQRSSKGPYGRSREPMSPSTLPCQQSSCLALRPRHRNPSLSPKRKATAGQEVQTPTQQHAREGAFEVSKVNPP